MRQNKCTSPCLLLWGSTSDNYYFQLPCSISISNSQHTKSLLNGQTIPKVYNKNTRTRFALFVFTPRKWTWVDHALAVGKISLSVSFNSTEGNAVWQTAIQNMRQWMILKTNMYLQGMWVLCSFIANLKKKLFWLFIHQGLTTSYYASKTPKLSPKWNQVLSKSIWESNKVHLLSCAWMEAGRRITGAESKQAATASFALVARSYSGQLDLGPCSVSRPEFVSILLSLGQGFS